MGLDKGGHMSYVPVECPALERLQRLGGPPQLIAESDPDPLRPVV